MLKKSKVIHPQPVSQSQSTPPTLSGYTKRKGCGCGNKK